MDSKVLKMLTSYHVLSCLFIQREQNTLAIMPGAEILCFRVVEHGLNSGIYFVSSVKRRIISF